MSRPTRFLSMSLAVSLLALAGCGGQSDLEPLPITQTPGWQAPERLDAGDGGALQNPQLAMNRQGTGMLAWEQRNGEGVNDVRARPVSVRGEPGPAISLGAAGSAYPDLAIDGQGRALAVWAQGSDTGSEVWARTYQPETGWGTAQMMSAPGADTATAPRAAINDAGHMAVVWLQTEGWAKVHARRYNPSQGWGAAVRLDSSSQETRNPEISLNAEGRLVVVWQQTDVQARTSVWANQIEPDGTVATAVQIEQGTGTAGTPALAGLGDTSVQAVWQRTNDTQGANQQIGMSRFLSGHGWSATASASGAERSLARSPSLASWGAANAVTAWVQTSGDLTEVWANRIVQGQAGEPQALQGGLTQAQDQARIGADDLGNAIGLWIRSEGGIPTTLWTTHWPVTGAPGEATRLDASTSLVVYEAELGVDAQGRALAVWTQSDGSGRQLWMRRYGAP